MAKKQKAHRATKKEDIFTGINKSRWYLYSQLLVAGALISILLAALGWLGVDFWLASTQWLVVAAVLAALGVYAKLES